MKKVININFKGRVIPIEEAAFETLQQYIESLRRFFAHEESRDEIINDIEDRIAELFNEELKKGATCITEDTVNGIIESMGRVEDFEAAEHEGKQATTGKAPEGTANTEEAEPRGSISRNGNDKILGGVCSGLAHYLRIDPSVLRIIFAVVTLGGFGLGVLIYVILWIVLPEKMLQPNIKKRLFRDPDHKVIGGVAAGIATYFNIAVWIPRLIFLLPVALGVFGDALFDFHIGRVIFTGGLGGTMFITYIVLWVVLPLAKTGVDKLQMRGEKIDIKSIRNTVKEELGSFKDKAGHVTDDIKTGAERMGAEVKEGAERMVSQATPVAQRVGSGLGQAIGILFKAFFLFIGGIVAFALLIALFGVTFAGMVAFPLKDFFFEPGLQNLSVWGTLIFFLFVPVVGILIWVVRKIVGAKSNPYLGYIFGSLWLLGWVSLMILIGSIAKNFRYEAVDDKAIELTAPIREHLLVKVNEPVLRYSGTYWWMDSNEEGWDINEDTLKYANIKVRIEKSSDSAYHVHAIRYSFGQNRKDAEAKAQKIQYHISSTENTVNLGSSIAIDKASKFRGQKVLVVIKVPVGKKIRFDASVEERLHPFNIRIRERSAWNKRYGTEYDFDFDSYFEYKPDVDYIMTPEGLTELDAAGKPVKPDTPSPKEEEENLRTPEREQYRYRGPQQDSQDRPEKTNKRQPVADAEVGEGYKLFIINAGELL